MKPTTKTGAWINDLTTLSCIEKLNIFIKKEKAVHQLLSISNSDRKSVV